MPFHIIRNDITKVRADAIVNTANPKPVCGSGTDSAVYRAAGVKKLLAERKKIGSIETGEVAVTPAFRLHAKYIIHTVGPVWTDGEHGEFALLASCYRKSLLIARQLGCKSIAFPLISTGVYGFPKDLALETALGQISAFLRDTQADEEEMEVFLVVFDKKAFDLSAGLVRDVSAYINENYVRDAHAREYGDARLEDKQSLRRRMADRWNLPSARRESGDSFHSDFAEGTFFGSDEPVAAEEPASWTAGPASGEVSEEEFTGIRPDAAADAFSAPVMQSPARPASPRPAPAGASGAPSKDPSRRQRSLQDILSHLGESFQECLLRLIDERGLTDVQVYKRANIDRKLFSKIRCNAAYSPHRRTAIALAIALELNRDEMTDLLRKAGIALSPGSKFDLIISYCVENHIYDLYTINAILFDYDQPLLGA